jgi:hypothetical protein
MAPALTYLVTVMSTQWGPPLVILGMILAALLWIMNGGHSEGVAFKAMVMVLIGGAILTTVPIWGPKLVALMQAGGTL